MVEQTWKKLEERVSKLKSFLDENNPQVVDDTKNGLDFSKWFEYKDTNLDNIHLSAEDTKDLNHERMQKFLGTEISTEKPDEKDVLKYVETLWKKDKEIVSHLADEWYDFNEIKAYMSVKDQFTNPMAEWTWIFERWDWKDTSVQESWWSNFSFDAKSIPWIVWWWAMWLLWLEWVWRWLYKWGDNIYRDAIKPTDKDVETLVKEAANEKKYKYHNDRAEKIKKEMDTLIEWDPKWDELNKQYNEEIATRDRYAPREKSTTVDLMDEAWVTWDNFNIASEANFQAEKHWTEKVKPYMDKSTKTFNKSDFIDKLTRELFKDVDDYSWKENYEPVIKKMKEVYAGQWEISLNELHEWKKQFQPSKNLLAWDTAQTTMKNINDKMYSMLTKEIKKTLDEENPWKKVWKAYSDYGKWLEEADEYLGKTQKEMTKETKRASSIKKWLQNKVDNIFGKWFKTKSWQLIKKLWKSITPSQWISAGKIWAWVTDVIWIVQLLRLVPWTIWELATQFIETTPAWVADEMLWDKTVGAGIAWWSWNRKSDDERIDYLKENLDALYWIEFPRDDIEYSYYKWKGNTDWNLHIEMDSDKWYFAWWQNNEALPVFVSNEEKDREYENERLNETVYKVLYMNAKSDDLRIKLIMDRYLVSEDKAKEMLNNMTAWWEYNNPDKFTGLKPWTRPA